MASEEKILILINEMTKEAQEEPQWEAESALKCLKKELLEEQNAIEPREQEETRIWTVCGNCSQHLISKWLWCPYCGRKVKWNKKGKSNCELSLANDIID